MTRAVEPPRLASRDDPTGRLLREAERAFRAQLSPERAWKRLQARRYRRWTVRFAVLAAATAAAVAFTRHQLEVRAETDVPTLVAEQIPRTQPSPTPRQAVDSVEPEQRVSPPASGGPRPRPSACLVPTSRSSAALPLPTEPLTELTCRDLASHARPERAVDCYQTIARQSGIGAEVALYEAARLSAEALDDAPRALVLLEQHGTRFPNSVLRVEVEWLKIRSLERAGRLDEALSASEGLLVSAAGRTLAPKLHLLRGRIYAGPRHECALALSEYVALLGEPGPAGDEAEFNRARCLEQLHKPDEARAAYQRYLGRPDARSAEAARARLAALPGPTEHSGDLP